jgi:hypothetical protein
LIVKRQNKSRTKSSHYVDQIAAVKAFESFDGVDFLKEIRLMVVKIDELPLRNQQFHYRHILHVLSQHPSSSVGE